jgi:hypothetical protein
LFECCHGPCNAGVSDDDVDEGGLGFDSLDGGGEGLFGADVAGYGDDGAIDLVEFELVVEAAEVEVPTDLDTVASRDFTLRLRIKTLEALLASRASAIIAPRPGMY